MAIMNPGWVGVIATASGQVPTACPQDHLTEAGRGLGLVSLVADSWGRREAMNGRSVFFELSWQPPIEGQ